MAEKQQRKDAAERRQAILAAAEVIFAEKGLEVPLDEICVAANVGRATLYRNFDNRIELVRAIMSNNLDKLEIIVGAPGTAEQRIIAYLSEVLAQLVTTGGLVYLIRNDPSYSDRFQRHLSTLVEGEGRGVFRADLDIAMIDIVVKMMSGALSDRTYAERQAAEPAILDLALRALR